MHGEDSPELGLVHVLVIGWVCFFAGGAAVLGAGTFATAIVTLDEPYSLDLFFLGVGTVLSAIAGVTAYFLAGGADGAVRGHEPFESILYWTSAAGLGGVALALLGIGVRAFFR